jgi:hypothetical protein
MIGVTHYCPLASHRIGERWDEQRDGIMHEEPATRLAPLFLLHPAVKIPHIGFAW